MGDTVQLMPAANLRGIGAAYFDHTITDGSNSDTARVTVGITCVNDAPVATSGSASTDEDTILEGSVSGTDIDGDTLTYTVVGDATHGDLVLDSDGTYSYTPDSSRLGSVPPRMEVGHLREPRPLAAPRRSSASFVAWQETR